MSEQSITVAKLDELAAFVINPPPKSRLETIFAGLKILVVFAYVFTRNRLVELDEKEASRRKQELELKRGQDTSDELKGDSLDGA